MQQKSGLKYMILEKKINTMRQELDVKEAQLHATTSPGSGYSLSGSSAIYLLSFTKLIFSGPHFGEVRDVVKEQNDRIKRLEKQISQMRLRRLWGDASSQGSSPGSSVSSQSSSSASSSSAASRSNEYLTE